MEDKNLERANKESKSAWKKIFLFIGIVFGLYLAWTVVAIFMNKENEEDKKAKLPIINPVQVDPQLVDQSVRLKGLNHRIGDFSFTNQNGETITQEFIKDKVFVVEYFFTTCGSICPIMNKEMQRVQDRFKDSGDVVILSHTVWPEVDSVEQMKRYAESHGADDKMWQFLTGSREDLYHMARTNYFTLKPAEVEGTGDGESDFIHTNNFVLIDKQKRIRGYYDGTNPDDVNKMMVDIENILNGRAD